MALGSRGQPMKQISLRSLNYLSDRKKLSPVVIMIVVALLATTHCACAQTLKVPGLTVLPPSYGPYSAHILQGGIGLTKPSTGDRSDCESERAVDNVCLG